MSESAQAVDRVVGEIGRGNWIRCASALEACNVRALVEHIERLSHTFRSNCVAARLTLLHNIGQSLHEVVRIWGGEVGARHLDSLFAQSNPMVTVSSKCSLIISADQLEIN